MTLAIVHSRATLGIDAPLVKVEVHLSNGLPNFAIVGLPETAVRESRERVRSALLNSQLEFPQQRTTINLAPVELPKAGGRFDLAIAVGILVASGQLAAELLANTVLVGELALSGEVRKVSAVLPTLLASARAGQRCIISHENATEAGLLQGAEVFLCSHLLELLQFLRGEITLNRANACVPEHVERGADFSDVVGQDAAKRALLIAAAGGHNVHLRGPPGTGKTMLAARLPGILPALTQEQALELAVIHSLSQSSNTVSASRSPPFRSPHHTCSAAALAGGGSLLHPGEISLAHNGVLFLDELAEFNPRVLDVLREPLETGCIRITRVKFRVELPSKVLLICASNPCFCGHFGDPTKACTCSPDKLQRYQQRISGPLLDRIDLHVTVPKLSEADKTELLTRRESACTSLSLREAVVACRERQLARSKKLNAWLQQDEISEHCALTKPDTRLLSEAMTRLQLSTRAFFRILKIARTIADLAGESNIRSAHLLEAINYRRN